LRGGQWRVGRPRPIESTSTIDSAVYATDVCPTGNSESRQLGEFVADFRFIFFTELFPILCTDRGEEGMDER
jgi:hypothetical protein